MDKQASRCVMRHRGALFTVPRRVDWVCFDLGSLTRRLLAQVLSINLCHEAKVVLALQVLRHHLHLILVYFIAVVRLGSGQAVESVHFCKDFLDILHRLTDLKVFLRILQNWHLYTILKLLVQQRIVFSCLFLRAELLSLGPQAFVLQVLLPGEALFSRVLRNQTLRIVYLKHVVLCLDLLTRLFIVDPVLQCRLAEAEAMDSRRAACVPHGVTVAHEIVRCHFRAVRI